MKFLVILLSLVAFVSAYPWPRPDDGYAPPAYGAPTYEAPVGRVKMQIYRGPSKGTGYDNFAPWGFYVTQPLDKAIPGYH